MPKIKSVITQRDIDVLLEKAFEDIENYFKQGTTEIKKVAELEGDFRKIDSNKFICRVYVHGSMKAACTIWLGGRLSNSINFVYGADPSAGSSLNESLAIDQEDGKLSLKPLMNLFGSNRFMSDEESASYLWKKLMEHVR